MKVLQLIRSIFALLVFSVLVSCGATDGGGTDSQTTAATSGRVSLLLTDGPTLDFDRINVTLESVSFIGGDDGHETIVFNESRVVNLLALQNYSDLLTTTVIPAGTYNKIRLHVSQVELVKLNPDGTVLSSDIAKLPANGKIDLNPQESFEVVGGGHLIIEFDMDAEKSIHIIETGNGKFNFRPVIFVNILGEEELKLVILDGKVLAKTETGFQLCAVELTEVNDSCMAVAITGNTVVQDDQIEALPAGDIDDNDIVTVLGKAGSKNVSALHIVIAADSESDQNLALFTGAATSVVDVDGDFSMLTDDDNDVVPPMTPLAVALADSARVFDKYGTVVSSDNIIDGSDIDVFGQALPNLATVDNVKAAFVIYDNKDDADNLSGVIAAIDGVESEITVTATVDMVTADFCVGIDAAKMYLLTIVEDSRITSSEITINDLQLGMSVDVYGDSSDPNCLSANIVLVAEAQ